MRKIISIFAFFAFFMLYIKIWGTGWWFFSTTNAFWQVFIFFAGFFVAGFASFMLHRLRVL